MVSVPLNLHPGRTMLDTISYPAATTSEIDREHASAKFASWCLVLLFLLACVGPRGANTVGGVSGEGDSMRQIGYILAAATTFYVCRSARWLYLFPAMAMLALGWCWLSLVWAIDPANGFRRLVLTTMLMAAIFAAVEVAGTQRALRVFGKLSVLILFINLFWVFGTSGGIHLPGEIIGDPGLAGNWKGAMGHKNYAGPYTAVTMLVLLLGPRFLPSLARWPVIGLAAVFLWGTQSMTSIGLFFVCLLAAMFYGLLGERGRRLLLPFTVFLVAVSLLLFGPEINSAFTAISHFITTPEAVTGRGEIWTALLQFISQNWLLGSGYGSLWGIGPEGPIQRLVSSSSWVENVYSGHNGYLDMLGMVGAPGLILVLVGFFVAPLARLTSSRAISVQTGALLFAILMFSLGHNFTESTLLTRDLVVWLMHAMAMAMIYKSSREEPGSPA